MGEPFERTMEIVNGILKPMGQSLKENPIPPTRTTLILESR